MGDVSLHHEGGLSANHVCFVALVLLSMMWLGFIWHRMNPWKQSDVCVKTGPHKTEIVCRARTWPLKGIILNISASKSLKNVFDWSFILILNTMNWKKKFVTTKIYNFIQNNVKFKFGHLSLFLLSKCHENEKTFFFGQLISSTNLLFWGYIFNINSRESKNPPRNIWGSIVHFTHFIECSNVL